MQAMTARVRVAWLSAARILFSDELKSCIVFEFVANDDEMTYPSALIIFTLFLFILF